MSPNQVTHKRNGKARHCNGFVPENRPVRKGYNNFGNGSHGRQNHNIDCRMRINPEKMLVQYRVATLGRIKKAYMQHTIGYYHQKGNTYHRGCQQLYPCCTIQRPDKQRHTKESHTRRPHPVNGNNKVKTSKNG